MLHNSNFQVQFVSVPSVSLMHANVIWPSISFSFFFFEVLFGETNLIFGNYQLLILVRMFSFSFVMLNKLEN